MPCIPKVVGIDLFSGAGGMSLGARNAGLNILAAVETDKFAAETYRNNFKTVNVLEVPVESLSKLPEPSSCDARVLFGGPPCQGFSTSNQRTRSSLNPRNWLFREFFRHVAVWNPDVVVFENVRGIIETEKGAFVEHILNDLADLGYDTSHAILNSVDFGVPQRRSRLFVVAWKGRVKPSFPSPTGAKQITVREAIDDLPCLGNGASDDVLPFRSSAASEYSRKMRMDVIECDSHLVTRNNSRVIERFKCVPQGGNWSSIPMNLLDNYKNVQNCHTGIYHRLSLDQPSVVIGNFRKNMLIHPIEDRGLSVREAARLQSFPDSFSFAGSIGFRQQQVGNAVPPLLAEVVFRNVMASLGGATDVG